MVRNTWAQWAGDRCRIKFIFVVGGVDGRVGLRHGDLLQVCGDTSSGFYELAS
jgi:hypothetical protein